MTPDKKPDNSSSAIIKDYRMAYCSRQVSLIGRREVMSGKAKFGIFGRFVFLFVLEVYAAF